MWVESGQGRSRRTLGSLVEALDALGDRILHVPQEVSALLSGLSLDPASYERYVTTAQNRYCRTLVHRSPHLEVLLLAWPHGARAPVHDHAGQWCWFVPLRGGFEVQSYRVLDADRTRGYAWLEVDGAPRVLGPGELDLRAAEQDLHSVRAVGDGLSLSLHIYAGPIDACGVYDVKRRRVRLRLLRYDQVGPRADERLLTDGAAPLAARGGTHEVTDVPQADEGGALPPPSAAPAPGAAAGEPRGGRTARRLLPPWRVLGKAWQATLEGVRSVRGRLQERRLLTEAAVPEAHAQLAVKTLRHRYSNDVEALSSVSLNVRSGDFVCLVGPSGCGKSTLLYALAGHIQPSGGSVSLDGNEVKGPGPDRLLMFQEPGLFPWLTVEGNIVFALGARGLPRRERKRLARRYIDLVQLGGFERARPHQLSGGMRMRASLARALAMESDVLLMDEPFGSLDAQTREDMHRLLQSIWRETKKTVVFVTHDLREALTLANRLVVMAPRPGRIVRDLELRLPFPRDPDGAELAALARQVRSLFREHATARAGARPETSNVERDDEPAETVDLRRQLPAVARAGVGDGL